MQIIETAHTFDRDFFFYNAYLSFSIFDWYIVVLVNSMVASDTEELSIPRPLSCTTSHFIARILASARKVLACTTQHDIVFLLSGACCSSSSPSPYYPPPVLITFPCLHHRALSDPFPSFANFERWLFALSCYSYLVTGHGHKCRYVFPFSMPLSYSFRSLAYIYSSPPMMILQTWASSPL